METLCVLITILTVGKWIMLRQGIVKANHETEDPLIIHEPPWHLCFLGYIPVSIW